MSVTQLTNYWIRLVTANWQLYKELVMCIYSSTFCQKWSWALSSFQNISLGCFYGAIGTLLLLSHICSNFNLVLIVLLSSALRMLATIKNCYEESRLQLYKATRNSTNSSISSMQFCLHQKNKVTRQFHWQFGVIEESLKSKYFHGWVTLILIII